MIAERDPAGTVADLIRKAGARATPARIRTLALLRAAPAPLSHAEIEAAMGGDPVDRVTLYRVLDWLMCAGFAQKTVDDRRVSRFAATVGEHGGHAHFRCDDCGRLFCLDSPPPAPPALPEGFELGRMETDIHGRCGHCAGAAQRVS